MGMTAQPSAPTAARGFVGEVLDVFNVLFDPAAVFDRIKQKPTIIAPWVVISVLGAVMAILVQPYQHAAMEALKASLPAAQASRVNTSQGLLRAIIGAPILTILAGAAGAGLLWLGVMLTATQARYKTLMSVLMHSQITFILFQIITFVVLTMRGVGAVGGLADMRPPLGLDLLAPNAGYFLGAVLNGINPFSIWGVWLCGVGVSIAGGISRSTAILVTAVVYVICLALISAPLLFLS
jgi:Yip1 domain